MVLDAINAGAKGYLLKPIKIENLKKVITDVYKKYGKAQNPGLDLTLDLSID